MLHRRHLGALLLMLSVVLLVIPLFAAKDKKPKDSFKVSGYIGKSSTSPAPGMNVALIDKETGKAVDSVSSNFLGRYKFKDVKPGSYVVKCEDIEREVTVVSKDIRLDIDLSTTGGVMDYGKKGREELAAAASAAASGSGAAAPAGPSDPALQQAMAGEYYAYGGSTERKLMLCAGGTFFDSRESSYSGTFREGGVNTGAWGQASASAGSGNYSIQGSQQSGTIHFSYKGGKRLVSHYRSTGERGCYSFDGQTFCYSGAARCQ